MLISIYFILLSIYQIKNKVNEPFFVLIDYDSPTNGSITYIIYVSSFRNILLWDDVLVVFIPECNIEINWNIFHWETRKILLRTEIFQFWIYEAHANFGNCSTSILNYLSMWNTCDWFNSLKSIFFMHLKSVHLVRKKYEADLGALAL